MLDPKFIIDNQSIVKDACIKKGVSFDVDVFVKIAEKRSEQIKMIDELRSRKNEMSGKFASASIDDKKKLADDSRAITERLAGIESDYMITEELYQSMLLVSPNIPHSDAPVGVDDASNKPLRFWHPQKGFYQPSNSEYLDDSGFDFAPRDHVSLSEGLDIVDTEKGVKVAGFRGYFLKNEGVWLHYGVLFYALHLLQKKGFNIFSVPTLIRDSNLFGSGHFPTGQAEVYQASNAKDATKDKEKLFLAGTSEPSLLGYYSDTLLEEKDLPVMMAGISPCYRSEIGSYGKDTKGLYRVHEFAKVEQVIISRNNVDESDRLHQMMTEISEEILQSLQIPYRVIANSTGDMGLGKYRMYDIESWMPGRGKYGETHSSSNLTDWQARRMNIKYQDVDGKKVFCHTLNNTAIASPRILIAIIENYQQEDGSLRVPDVLVPYVGKSIINPK